MFRRLTCLVVAIFLTGTAFIRAQNSQVMYYMNLPQNHLMNPALRPSNGFYLGLGITGIGLTLNNNFLSLSDVLIPGRSDSLITFLHPDYNVDEFFKKLGESNFLMPEVDVQLFGLGFNAGKNTYVFMDLTERVHGNFVLPGDLIKLGLGGNENFVGKTVSLDNLDLGLQYFREAGVGFSTMATDNLRLGFRARFLFGLAGASLQNNNLSLTVNDDFTHTLNANLVANISAPVQFFFDSENNPDSVEVNEEKLKSPDFFLSTSNFGMGIDAGALYNISHSLTLSAFITDIGYIRWKNDVTTMKAEGQFEFSGLNVKDVVNGTKTFDELTKDLLDSLKNSFVRVHDNQPFKTYLTPCFGLGASYNITKSLGLGLLSRTYFSSGEVKEAITFSANLNAGNVFSATAAYTATNYSYDNFGAGLAFRTGFLQFYILADKIPVMWNKIISGGTTIPLPASWNLLNLRFGVNMVLGNRIKKKTDRPMLKVE